jgi:hypothetical protein
MPPLSPKPNFKKEVKVTTIPPSKKRQKSFFEEYYYPVLAVEFVIVALVVGAGGMGFWRGILVGLLIAAVTAVAWQFRQYARFKDHPSAQLNLAPKPPEIKPIRPAKRAPVPVGPDGKKVFPPSYFPPLRDKKPNK